LGRGAEGRRQRRLGDGHRHSRSDTMAWSGKMQAPEVRRGDGNRKFEIVNSKVGMVKVGALGKGGGEGRVRREGSHAKARRVGGARALSVESGTVGEG
jgi:hypothetical protein